MKTVLDGVIFQVGNKAGYIDNCHPYSLAQAMGCYRYRVNPAVILDALYITAQAVRDALDDVDDWGLSGLRPTQYSLDVAADAAALSVLHAAGFSVMSEESGLTGGGDVIVVLDPVDGSTNCSRGIPWFATSMCAVDGDGPVAAVVVNQATGERFDAVRGRGARRDGLSISCSGVTDVSDAMIGLNGFPPAASVWRQSRILGAIALDLCAVASGRLDGYIDCCVDAHGSWDYLAGMLICHEAGAVVSDAFGRDLVTVAHADRRTPIAGSSQAVHDALLAHRLRK